MAYKRDASENHRRSTGYKPPELLAAPEAPPGQAYRWVRVMLDGEDDVKNISQARQEGWEPVAHDEIKETGHPVHLEGRFQGAVGFGDLVLFKNSSEYVEGKRAYEQELTARQMNAVDNDLMKEQHPSMPIFRERTSQVTGGKRRPKIDD